jgi:O-methyltransferase
MVPESLGIGSADMAVLCSLLHKSPPGDAIEVGVYRGGSAYYLAQVCREQGRRLHLFDTFFGMPWEGPSDKYRTGDLADCSAEAVQALIPDAFVYAGVFPGTFPDNLQNIAFAHIDCDQYQSVKLCIEAVWPRMVPGGIMYFDDYYWIRGATEAVEQAFSRDILLPGASNRAYVIKQTPAHSVRG